MSLKIAHNMSRKRRHIAETQWLPQSSPIMSSAHSEDQNSRNNISHTCPGIGTIVGSKRRCGGARHTFQNGALLSSMPSGNTQSQGQNTHILGMVWFLAKGIRTYKDAPTVATRAEQRSLNKTSLDKDLSLEAKKKRKKKKRGD